MPASMAERDIELGKIAGLGLAVCETARNRSHDPSLAAVFVWSSGQFCSGRMSYYKRGSSSMQTIFCRRRSLASSILALVDSFRSLKSNAGTLQSHYSCVAKETTSAFCSLPASTITTHPAILHSVSGAGEIASIAEREHYESDERVDVTLGYYDWHVCRRRLHEPFSALGDQNHL